MIWQKFNNTSQTPHRIWKANAKFCKNWVWSGANVGIPSWKTCAKWIFTWQNRLRYSWEWASQSFMKWGIEPHPFRESFFPISCAQVFSSWVLYTVMTNTDDYLKVEPNYLLAMQVMVGLTWLSWLSGLGSIGMRTEPKEWSPSEYGRTPGLTEYLVDGS